MSLSSSVRELLRSSMVARGVSVTGLARSLGRPAAEVEARLLGEGPLSLDWVEEVLGVLGVPPAELFGRLDEGRRGQEGPGSNPGAGLAEREDVVGREEVEELLEEARSLLREAARGIEAREHGEGEAPDS